MTYEDLCAALKEFDLPEQITIRQIRERHRELVRLYHPDAGNDSDGRKIRRINAAYKILNEYVSAYRFDFSRETFMRQYPEERLREQFFDVDLWGKQD